MNCPGCGSEMSEPPADMTGWLNYDCDCGMSTTVLYDGVDWPPEDTGERCGCGNNDRMRGYRVCQTCAQARLFYPHLFEECPPDKLDDAPVVVLNDPVLYARPLL